MSKSADPFDPNPVFETMTKEELIDYIGWQEAAITEEQEKIDGLVREWAQLKEDLWNSLYTAQAFNWGPEAVIDDLRSFLAA